MTKIEEWTFLIYIAFILLKPFAEIRSVCVREARKPSKKYEAIKQSFLPSPNAEKINAVGRGHVKETVLS